MGIKLHVPKLEQIKHLTSHPKELHNLLNEHDADLPKDIKALRDQIDGFDRVYIEFHERLGVVPGDRGFVEGWE